jgi:hypothetical protein
MKCLVKEEIASSIGKWSQADRAAEIAVGQEFHCSLVPVLGCLV